MTFDVRQLVLAGGPFIPAYRDRYCGLTGGHTCDNETKEASSAG